jgi:hypothetical protein
MLKSMAHRFSLRSRLVGLGMRLNWGFSSIGRVFVPVLNIPTP